MCIQFGGSSINFAPSALGVKLKNIELLLGTLGVYLHGSHSESSSFEKMRLSPGKSFANWRKSPKILDPNCHLLYSITLLIKDTYIVSIIQ